MCVIMIVCSSAYFFKSVADNVPNTAGRWICARRLHKLPHITPRQLLVFDINIPFPFRTRPGPKNNKETFLNLGRKCQGFLVRIWTYSNVVKAQLGTPKWVLCILAAQHPSIPWCLCIRRIGLWYIPSSNILCIFAEVKCCLVSKSICWFPTQKLGRLPQTNPESLAAVILPIQDFLFECYPRLPGRPATPAKHMGTTTFPIPPLFGIHSHHRGCHSSQSGHKHIAATWYVWTRTWGWTLSCFLSEHLVRVKGYSKDPNPSQNSFQ